MTQHAYHLFIFRYLPEAFGGMSRADFMAALKAEGVPCSPGYSPLYRSPAFKIDTKTHPYPSAVDYGKYCLPEVEQACEEAVWLQQALLLAEKSDMDDVLAAVRKIQVATRG